MGCKIKWTGRRTLTILGVKKLKELQFKIMFDRIEAGTYMIISALTGGNLKITYIDPKIITTEVIVL